MTDSERPPHSLAGDAANTFKGVGMGICDAVPGVSGGTVALVVGIYDRLFHAISRFDKQFIKYLRKFELVKALHHVDARFLLTLLMGIGFGYVAMSFAIKYLMADATLRSLTLASFTGMILGSIYLVFRMIRPSGRLGEMKCFGWGMSGCAISMFIAFQNLTSAAGEISLWYLFVCSVVAICAMILPGISGAMLLLIFGVYYYVIDIPRNLIHFENVGVNLVRLLVVISGCLVGLLSFARLLKWLMRTCRPQTLSAMLGLMAGSLIVLWPFQHRIEPTIEHHKPTYRCYVPEEFSLTILGVAGAIVFFAVVVVLVDRFAKVSKDNSDKP